MLRSNKVTAAAALALAALLGTEVSALAQDAGASDQTMVRSDARMARRPLYLRRHAERSAVVAREDGYRPLTVARRRVVAPGPVVVEGPSYNPYAGPTAIVTGPIAIGGEIATLPFRILSEIFPPVGPGAIIGVPARAAGQLVAAPFQIAEAPFGGPGPFAY